MCEALGSAVERFCAKWPGLSLTAFVLAVYVVGALLDGETL